MAEEYCIEGGYCYSLSGTASTLESEGCLIVGGAPAYSSMGARIYKDTYINDSFHAIFPSSPGFSALQHSMLAQPWASTYNALIGAMNNCAVNYAPDCQEESIDYDEVTIGFHFHNTGQPKLVYLGFGANIVNDGAFSITHNMTELVSLSATSIGNNNAVYINSFWHIIPVVMVSCDNFFNFTFKRNESQQAYPTDDFGVVIYDNSFDELTAATTSTSLTEIFNSRDLIRPEPKSKPYDCYSCPEGYMLSGTSSCIKIDYQECACNCCKRYRIIKRENNTTFMYYDCNMQIKTIADMILGEEREVCACSIIGTPTANSRFNGHLVILLNDCDETCISHEDGPIPPEPPAPVCSDCNFTSISVGDRHTIGISGGTLFSWGDNSHGQLGLGYSGGSFSSPQPVAGPALGVSDWAYVEAGSGSTYAINESGELFVCGNALCLEGLGDQLGLGGAASNYHTLTQITSPVSVGWEKIWSKATSVIALMSGGTIMGTGFNKNGQLGLPNTSYDTFTQIGSDSDWKDISRGLDHSLGLKVNGSVYAWGTNTVSPLSDPLGLGATSYGIKKDVPEHVTALTTPMTMVAAGNNHSLGIDILGRMWGWGSSSHGQLDCDGCTGLNTSLPHLLDGKITVGYPQGTSTGPGANSNFIHISAIGDTSIAITDDILLDFIPFTDPQMNNWTPSLTGHRVWGWGRGYGQSKILLKDISGKIPHGKNDWCNIWSGGENDHSMRPDDRSVHFMKDLSGNMEVWGDNSHRQLGIGDHPICFSCYGTTIPQMGMHFNFNSMDCEKRECNCMRYRMDNASNETIKFEYIACGGLMTEGSLPPGRESTTTFCACDKTLRINGFFVPELVSVLVLGPCN